jgi:hypothetical protein
LAIVLSVLRFTASDYPFGIFKLFFRRGSIYFKDLQVVLLFFKSTEPMCIHHIS